MVVILIVLIAGAILALVGDGTVRGAAPTSKTAAGFPSLAARLHRTTRFSRCSRWHRW